MAFDLSEIRLHLVDSLEEVERFMRWLGETRPVLAIDTETEGLSFVRDRVRLVQFGDLATGWAIPWEWSGIAYEAIAQYEGHMVYHNASFDTKHLEHWRDGGFKLPWSQMDDTYIMARLLDPVGSAGLKQLTAQHIDTRAAYASKVLDQAMKEQNWTWKTVPLKFEPYWAYGALDTVLTAHLWTVLKPQIDARVPELYAMEMQCLRLLIDMEVRGCRIDLDYTRNMLVNGQAYVDQVEAWCVENYGFKPGANQKVAERLLNDGVNLTEVTATGRWKLDVDVLEAAAAHPLAAQVLSRRKTEKICSSYLENFLEMANGDLLHPSINSLAARTGRMSITEPGLQTLPRGASVRNCFIPRDGNVLLSVDFDQVEYRLMAHFSQDPGLIAAFGGDDFFNELARKIFQDPTIVKGDKRRDLTKNTAYGKAYGAGVAKMALTAGVPEEHMQFINDQLNVLYPGMGAFQQAVTTTVQRRQREEGEGYVTTPLGRKLIIDKDKAYAGTNALIQATAADVLKTVIIDLDKAGFGELCLIPVHDECLFDLPAGDCEEVERAIVEVMTQRDYTVPLTAGGSGPLDRWGTKYA